MEQDVIRKIERLLQAALAESDAAPPAASAAIDPHADFSALQINSVDLMEFVIRVEQEFRVSVLDDLAPEDFPTTMAGWAELVRARRESAARPT